ncbi:MAG: GNAT family N-acetyltransferase [Sphaerospermopsis sp. SIO1G2]|nr:GNAT family N-acetyltransferase [Sphaerospermopsis sp. SIO1G1]NET72533.1 GNAT family N-acetyltransferase [Sphaerospermopsis sp. SIO1G2]
MEQVFTERLLLVPFKLDIVKTAILDNSELAKFLGVNVLPDWQDQESSQNLPDIANILEKYPFQSKWGWGSLVIHQQENTLIGHVMIKVIPDATFSPTDAVEIGYYIAPSHRQQGYGTEAAKAMADLVLSQPDMQTVTAGCDPKNIASQRVLEKIGMELITPGKEVLVWKLSKST